MTIAVAASASASTALASSPFAADAGAAAAASFAASARSAAVTCLSTSTNPGRYEPRRKPGRHPPSDAAMPTPSRSRRARARALRGSWRLGSRDLRVPGSLRSRHPAHSWHSPTGVSLPPSRGARARSTRATRRTADKRPRNSTGRLRNATRQPFRCPIVSRRAPPVAPGPPAETPAPPSACAALSATSRASRRPRPRYHRSRCSGPSPRAKPAATPIARGASRGQPRAKPRLPSPGRVAGLAGEVRLEIQKELLVQDPHGVPRGRGGGQVPTERLADAFPALVHGDRVVPTQRLHLAEHDVQIQLRLVEHRRLRATTVRAASKTASTLAKNVSRDGIAAAGTGLEAPSSAGLRGAGAGGATVATATVCGCIPYWCQCFRGFAGFADLTGFAGARRPRRRFLEEHLSRIHLRRFQR